LIRVLIADDHAVVRRGLTEILVRELEGAVCDEAENAEQAITKVRGQDWDLVILDIAMPGRSGLDVLRDIRLDVVREFQVIRWSVVSFDLPSRHNSPGYVGCATERKGVPQFLIRSEKRYEVALSFW